MTIPKTTTLLSLASLRTRVPPAGVIASAIYIALVVFLCIFGPLVAPMDPGKQELLAVAQPPGDGHILGTDPLGRDIASRLIVGTPLTVLGPVVVSVLVLAISVPLALVSVFRGGLLEAIVMRISDTLLAIPSMLMIIVVVGLFGGGYWIAVAVLTVLMLPGDLRIIRSVVLGQLSSPYLEAARVMNVRPLRLLFVYILPNLIPTALACIMLSFATALLTLSSLAFLGLGAPPGATDWGTMLADNRLLITENPAAVVIPALLLIGTGLAVTTIGDWFHGRFEKGKNAN